MATRTQIRGDKQIMDLTIDLVKLQSPFISSTTGDWDITNGAADATITGLPAPVNPADAVNKAYVDNLVQGVSWKEPARVATDANVAIATDLEAGDVIDGVTLVAGDRVLVKDQTTGTENGLYIVQATGAALRDPEWATGTEVRNYSLFVSEGTCADAAFVVTNDAGSDVVDTDALNFVKFASVNPGFNEVCNEAPTVTDASPTVTLANTDIEPNTEKIYLNGLRQEVGAAANYTINPTTGVVTFCFPLEAGDVVVADYKL